MRTSITKILEGVGLSKKQAEILNILFQFESLKAQEIAKKAHINRTTTYGLIKSLVDRGLVTSRVRAGVTEYQSIEPALLPSYIDRQKNALDLRKTELESLLPEIQMLRKQSDVFPQMSFFEGIEGVKQAYEDTLESNKEKFIHCLSGPDAIYERLGKEWINYYVKKRTDLGIRCVGIAADSPFVRETKLIDRNVLRITKILPKEFALEIEINIYDAKVALFSFAKDKPLAVIIEDQSISNSMKTLFSFIEQHVKA